MERIRLKNNLNIIQLRRLFNYEHKNCYSTCWYLLDYTCYIYEGRLGSPTSCVGHGHVKKYGRVSVNKLQDIYVNNINVIYKWVKSEWKKYTGIVVQDDYEDILYWHLMMRTCQFVRLTHEQLSY